NGKVVKKDLDLFVENGNKQTILQFHNIEVTNGKLSLELQASSNNATISGLAIINQSGIIDNQEDEHNSPEPEVTPEPGKTPSGTAYYYNTTSTNDVPYGNNIFAGINADYLLTSKTNVGSNAQASNDALFQKV